MWFGYYLVWSLEVLLGVGVGGGLLTVITTINTMLGLATSRSTLSSLLISAGSISSLDTTSTSRNGYSSFILFARSSERLNPVRKHLRVNFQTTTTGVGAGSG